MDMFYQPDGGNSMTPSPLPPTPSAKLSYEEVVKELIHEEKQYQRDLHMIIRVFREELVKIVKDPRVSIFLHSFELNFYFIFYSLSGIRINIFKYYGYLRGNSYTIRFIRRCY